MAAWHTKCHFLLNVVEGPGLGCEFELGWTPATVGRAKDNRIPIRDRLISRFHGTFEVTWGRGVIVFSDHSQNGTYVQRDGSTSPDFAIHNAAVIVAPGDILLMGSTSIQLVKRKGQGKAISAMAAVTAALPVPIPTESAATAGKSPIGAYPTTSRDALGASPEMMMWQRAIEHSRSPFGVCVECEARSPPAPSNASMSIKLPPSDLSPQGKTPALTSAAKLSTSSFRFSLDNLDEDELDTSGAGVAVAEVCELEEKSSAAVVSTWPQQQVAITFEPDALSPMSNSGVSAVLGTPRGGQPPKSFSAAPPVLTGTATAAPALSPSSQSDCPSTDSDDVVIVSQAPPAERALSVSSGGTMDPPAKAVAVVATAAAVGRDSDESGSEIDHPSDSDDSSGSDSDGDPIPWQPSGHTSVQQSPNARSRPQLTVALPELQPAAPSKPSGPATIVTKGAPTTSTPPVSAPAPKAMVQPQYAVSSASAVVAVSAPQQKPATPSVPSPVIPVSSPAVLARGGPSVTSTSVTPNSSTPKLAPAAAKAPTAPASTQPRVVSSVAGPAVSPPLPPQSKPAIPVTQAAVQGRTGPSPPQSLRLEPSPATVRSAAAAAAAPPGKSVPIRSDDGEEYEEVEVEEEVEEEYEYEEVEVEVTDDEGQADEDLEDGCISVLMAEDDVAALTTAGSYVSGDVRYELYNGETHLPAMAALFAKDLSEPYSVFTYRFFVHQWPHLCILAFVGSDLVGAIVCKEEKTKKLRLQGYVAMLAVAKEFRHLRIGTTLSSLAIKLMRRTCDEVMLETEVVNKGALKLYDNLGFTRVKILPKYYLNGGDAIRLKLWFK